jgi:L-threonylcarbamoyladenylate synthase
MPRVLVVDPARPDPGIVAEAARALCEGKLVAFPTETVYGLGARATDREAVRRVYLAKGRPQRHPLIAHVTGEAAARALASRWPEAAARLVKAFWPGPLTVVVDRAPDAPECLQSDLASIAVRAPSHTVAQALLAAVGEPIAAPSANRFQGISPTTAAHVVSQLGDAVDLVIDGGPCEAGIESTVVDVRRPAPRVLRLGAVRVSEIRRVLPDVDALAERETPKAWEPRDSPGMDARHYAPRARVHVVADGAGALARARRLAEDLPGTAPVGLIGHEREYVRLVADRIVVCALMPSPRSYERTFYAALHCLDDMGVAAIVIQDVPRDAAGGDDAWAAVADRIRRAAAPPANGKAD